MLPGWLPAELNPHYYRDDWVTINQFNWQWLIEPRWSYPWSMVPGCRWPPGWSVTTRNTGARSRWSAGTGRTGKGWASQPFDAWPVRMVDWGMVCSSGGDDYVQWWYTWLGKADRLSVPLDSTVACMPARTVLRKRARSVPGRAWWTSVANGLRCWSGCCFCCRCCCLVACVVSF